MHRAAGFSLVELAIVIGLITLLLGSVLVPLQSQVESRKQSDTEKILDNAREALIGYAAANGYFPCPADSTSNGQEATGSSHGSPGSCPASVSGGNNTYHGFLPAAVLGFTPIDANGYAVDAWGITQNRIRYAVSNRSIAGTTRTLVSAGLNGMRSAGMAGLLADTNLLKICSSGTGASATACGGGVVSLADNVPVVIWSSGPNAATTGGVAPHEDKNLNQNRVFVMRDRSDVTGNLFDDIVVWIPFPILFSRLLAAGQLP